MRNLLAFVVLAFAYGISIAHATCTEPAGAYVGSGSGLVLNQTTGAITGGRAMSVQLRTGAKTIFAVGKYLYGTGPSETTYVITSMTFDAKTCLGSITLNDGEVFAYSSSNSGNTVTLTYITNDNVLDFLNLVLQRE